MSSLLLSQIAAAHSRSPQTLRRLVYEGAVPYTRNELGHVLVDARHVAALVALAPRTGAIGPRKLRLAAAPEDVQWMRSAACAQTDPELFYPPDQENAYGRQTREAAAKKVCAGCAVLAQCRTWIDNHPDEWGVWAGLGRFDRQPSATTTEEAA